MDEVALRDYVDRLFEEHRQQVQAALSAHDKRVDMNHEAIVSRFVGLQDQMNRRIGENERAIDIAEKRRVETANIVRVEERRATEIAEREREKASTALRQEQHRASDTAAHEREKAEAALATALREHIENQVQQINGALEAVEGRAVLRHQHTQSEFLMRQKASDAAVQKAEDAQKDVNVRSNEFRGQLKDQNATMMPRLEAEALLKEIRSMLDKLDDKLVTTNTRIEGFDARALQRRESTTDHQATQQMSMSALGLVIAFAAIFVTIAIFIATHV